MCPSSYSNCTPYCMSEFGPLVVVAVVMLFMVLLNQWILIKLKLHE